MRIGKGDNVLAAVLEQRWRDYRLQFKSCRRAFSEEAVHDLRVASRRFLAVLDIVRDVDPQPFVQKTRRFFKDQLDELDELRDVQVMLVVLAENLPAVPELLNLQPYLQKRERRLLRAAQMLVKDSRVSELRERVDQIRASLEKQTRDQKFAATLLQAVDSANARVRQAYDQIDAQKPASIHQTRIAFKKFRYMAEIVWPLLPTPPEDYFKRMHDYQSVMGDIRDIVVFQAALADFAKKGASPIDSKPIHRYFEKRLAESVTAFVEDKGELYTFWRPASDGPFPWEKNHDSVHHPPRHRRAGEPERGRRQPATPDPERPTEDASDRPGPEETAGADRPDSDQPISAGR